MAVIIFLLCYGLGPLLRFFSTYIIVRFIFDLLDDDLWEDEEDEEE